MTVGKELLYLSRRDVESVKLTIDECIDILEDAYRAKARGEIEMPKKPKLGNPTGDGFLFAYLAKIGEDRLGMKWLGARPSNKALGLPQIHATILLNDPESFAPVAILDGASVTGMRTSGVSGIALRHLAREDSETAAILGCGYEGRMHLRVAAVVCKNLKRVRAWSPNPETARKFAREMGEETGLAVEAAEDARSAARAADVVISSTPIGGVEDFAMMHADWFREGVTAISISRTNHFFADAFFSFDKYFVDDRETMALNAERRSFEACENLHAQELGELLLGGSSGRDSAAQKILFLSEGLAINDISIGWEIYRRALAQGIGTILSL